MLPGRQMPQAMPQENPLWLSWHDTQMMAALTPLNVLDYFCRKSNPFYDRMCNNESIRMQRLDVEGMKHMVGVEYILLHVLEPILYVIRKQHRHSPTETTPLADYYIIAGMVYKAPDLASVINSRLLCAVTNLQQALDESLSYARFHPNTGYSWDFSSNKLCQGKGKESQKKKNQRKYEGTLYHVQRVNMLLGELLHKFPVSSMEHIKSVAEMSDAIGVPNPLNVINWYQGNTEPSNNQSQSGQIPQAIEMRQPDAIDMRPPTENKQRP